MNDVPVQNFENHSRFVKSYHGVAFGMLAVSVLWALYQVVVNLAPETVVFLVFSVGVLLLFFHTRNFPITVQDRLIRLEERLRYETLLPEDLQDRIAEFSLDQIISLRFASDSELPELARRVLDEDIQNRKDIKKLVRDWKADFLRV